MRLERESASGSKQEITALQSELVAVKESLKNYQERYSETIKELELRELEIERFNSYYSSQDFNLSIFNRHTRFLSCVNFLVKPHTIRLTKKEEEVISINRKFLDLDKKYTSQNQQLSATNDDFNAYKETQKRMQMEVQYHVSSATLSVCSNSAVFIFSSDKS